METPQNANNNNSATAKDFEVTGVSRSGRIRKKSSKLLDFQSPDEVENKKPKRIVQTSHRQGRPPGPGRGRPPSSGKVRKQLESVDNDAIIARTTPTVINDDDDDDDENTDDAWDGSDEERLSSIKPLDNDITAADSDDELDELVADIVEGVEAESLEHGDSNGESKVRQSIYMTEKANKRKMLKDGKVVTRKMERKDKGKTRFTAYSLWAREFRKSAKFKDLDFSTTARRLSEMWSNVSIKEKNAWRRKAKMQASKIRARESTIVKSNKQATPSSISSVKVTPTSSNSTLYNNRATTSRTKKLAAERQKTPPPATTPTTTITPTATNKKKRYTFIKSNADNEIVNDIPIKQRTTPTNAINCNTTTNNNKNDANELPNIEVIDAAAHLNLLGESLTIIGESLKDHEGAIAVAGSLSVLLDSLICSIAPLLCLTKHLPGLEKEHKLKNNLAETLDNIAYVMPGL